MANGEESCGSTSDKLLENLNHFIANKGFEIHPFKVCAGGVVGWYNDKVDERFHLQYNKDTLAVLLLSTPDMFEQVFLPFVKSGDAIYSRDPLDESISHFVKQLINDVLSGVTVHPLYDYEMDERTRRPKIMMQTAGHVSGAAYYYQKHHITRPDAFGDEDIFGVSIHPDYGGWFAFRAALILPDIQHTTLIQRSPPDVVPIEEHRIRLLHLFNIHWRDNRYRDIIPSNKQYSKLQQLYFTTAPKDRQALLDRVRESWKNRDDNSNIAFEMMDD